jgi:ABC-type nickel/cobalt efflux system permease component RcnA
MGIDSPLRRRLRFAVVGVISQLLLIALAIAWLIFMLIIAVNGSVYFVERNLIVRWLEVAAVVLIILFATGVFIAQLKRLGERRRDDDRRGGGRG